MSLYLSRRGVPYSPVKSNGSKISVPPTVPGSAPPKLRANEEGYCRIIDAAVRSNMDESEVADAIEAERVVSKRHYDNRLHHYR